MSESHDVRPLLGFVVGIVVTIADLFGFGDQPHETKPMNQQFASSRNHKRPIFPRFLRERRPFRAEFKFAAKYTFSGF